MTESAKALLVILDGWGLTEDPDVSAIAQADTPCFSSLWASNPRSRLRASESAVGLPEHQMGNSEVGHINIGAGRVVPQDLKRITDAIESRQVVDRPAWRDLITYCRENDKPLHLFGLISAGGVHSDIQHLFGLLDILKDADLRRVYIHCVTDGRDTYPRSARFYVRQLQRRVDELGFGKIATLVGRYYAMDRDQRWERTRQAWELLVEGKGARHLSASDAVEAAYADGHTDEFIPPCVLGQSFEAPVKIEPGDALLNFNFRTDRNRQISRALTQENRPDDGMRTIPGLHYVTFTRYDRNFQGVDVLFEREELRNGLGEILEREGKRQLRIAETEKYAHVTFFFNGGREKEFKGEDRVLVPSPKVATYDQQPEMSAAEVRDRVVEALGSAAYDFVCVNFANPDMVGHTGNFDAAVTACEFVDGCLADVMAAARAQNYHCIIIADHGNADRMVASDGAPHTAHTLAKVPCIYAGPAEENVHLSDGVLGDVAPTLLRLMGLPVPKEMTGRVLLEEVPALKELQ